MSRTPLLYPMGDPAGAAPGEPHPQHTPGDAEPPPRQCGRCRSMFDGDPTLYAPAKPDWWVCPPCGAALLGRDPYPNEVSPRRRTGDAS